MPDKTKGSHFDDLIDKALAAGKSVDLSGCAYGVNGAIPAYYSFLAGFCRHTKSARILEIGTFQGGSTHAMLLGIQSAGGLTPNIVTVDLEARDTRQINGKTGIRKIIGDPLVLPKFEEICDAFEGAPIDLMFLDSTKVGRAVLAQFATLAMMLRPKYVILDDITLNDSMERMWKLLSRSYGERAVNIGMAYPGIRKMAELNPKVVRHPGFGLIEAR